MSSQICDLRPMTRADLPALAAWLRTPHVGAWFRWLRGDTGKRRGRGRPEATGRGIGSEAIRQLLADTFGRYPDVGSVISRPARE